MPYRPLLPGSPSTDDSTDSMPEQQLSEHDGKDDEPSEVVCRQSDLRQIRLRHPAFFVILRLIAPPTSRFRR